jgi:hypothetical protein
MSRQMNNTEIPVKMKYLITALSAKELLTISFYNEVNDLRG